MAFKLGDNGCGQTGGYAVEAHQGSSSNQFSHIRGNTRHDKSPRSGKLPDTCFGSVGDEWWSCQVGKIRARIGAHAGHRSSHQSGVSDIDA
jgi:hypothetical protein